MLLLLLPGTTIGELYLLPVLLRFCCHYWTDGCVPNTGDWAVVTLPLFSPVSGR